MSNILKVSLAGNTVFSFIFDGGSSYLAQWWHMILVDDEDGFKLPI